MLPAQDEISTHGRRHIRVARKISCHIELEWDPTESSFDPAFVQPVHERAAQVCAEDRVKLRIKAEILFGPEKFVEDFTLIDSVVPVIKPRPKHIRPVE